MGRNYGWGACGKIDVNPKTIQRLRSGENKNPDSKTVVAICIAMRLHPDLSFHLISEAGLNFKLTEEDLTYKFLIRSCYTHSIDECNNLLISQGYKSLSKSYEYTT